MSRFTGTKGLRFWANLDTLFCRVHRHARLSTMRTRFLKRSFVHWILALGLLANRGAVGATEPKLVVAIMVDQMRYDYLERFASFFSTNGFRLLMDRGAFMTFGRYNYVPTVTGAGHASYLSGAGPAEHGIIGNSWFDKVRRKNVYCVGDSR